MSSKIFKVTLQILLRSSKVFEDSLKTTWSFETVPLKGSFSLVLQSSSLIFEVSFRLCSKGLPRWLKCIYWSCCDLQKSLRILYKTTWWFQKVSLKGSFVCIAKIFIDLWSFFHRFCSKGLPRSLKFLYKSCYDLQKYLRILYKTTWWFQKVSLKGSFVCIAKVLIDLWSFFYRFWSKGLTTSNMVEVSLQILLRSSEFFEDSLQDNLMISKGFFKRILCMYCKGPHWSLKFLLQILK